MIGRIATVAVLLASTSGACGDSGGSGPMTGATCTTGMVTLLGELDGQPVDVSTPLTGWAFQQLTPPYSLDLPFDSSILHMEWTTAIPDGGSGAASGTVVIPANAPHAGETICGASGTMAVKSGSTSGSSDYRFTLATLSSGPTCPGTSLAGSLAGCARTNPPLP